VYRLPINAATLENRPHDDFGSTEAFLPMVSKGMFDWHF
jgi:hypothetical protein